MKGHSGVVTYDESEGNDKNDRIYTVFLGDMVKSQTVDKEYNHYSVLKNDLRIILVCTLNSGRMPVRRPLQKPGSKFLSSVAPA